MRRLLSIWASPPERGDDVGSAPNGAPADAAAERFIIFVNTLPKSASRFVVHSLRRAYRAKTAVIVGGQFPNAAMSRGVLQRLRSGTFIAQEHVAPDHFNRMVIEEQIPRMILHVRDPRQVIISWAHHLDEQIAKGNRIALATRQIPADYASYPLAQKLDFVIDNHLSMFANWLRTWCKVLDGGTLRIPVLLTRFEDMTANPAGFFARIVAFYGVEPANPIDPSRPEPGQMHFRAGKVDEWRTVMDSAQKNRAHDIIGGDLLRYYGWVP